MESRPGATRVAPGRLRIGQRPPGAGPGRRLAPFTRARDLEAAVCLLGLARYPGRYREAAGAWLARMLASAGPAV